MTVKRLIIKPGLILSATMVLSVPACTATNFAGGIGKLADYLLGEAQPSLGLAEALWAIGVSLAVLVLLVLIWRALQPRED
jgi:disulfide bond formation protein DsbB